jgi:flagellar biosynthesis regulator FlaF
MFTYVLRPTISLTLTGGCNIDRRIIFRHSRITLQTTSIRNVPAKSPLPAPSLSSPKHPIDPVKAKQRYLESIKRTEEFLKDPQNKMNKLQAEINQVKERLDKEVYNKSIWQRLTDPLRRKQHSLINMIAATFAYILAFQLHLKRQANQQLTEEIQTQEETVKNLNTLLRSLLDDEFIQDMATTLAYENIIMMTENNRKDGPWLWRSVRMFKPAPTERDGLSPTQIDTMAQILRNKLEERIGDEGLDEHAKKERGMERIWKENQQALKSNEEDHLAGFLTSTEENEHQQEGDSSIKKQRIFDM